MTIRSNPHVAHAIAIGFVSALVSWRLLEGFSAIWPITIGAGVAALILFLYPQKGPSIELHDGSICLSDGPMSRTVRLSDVRGYRIDRITSLNLELILHDGTRMTHPLEFIGSLSDLDKQLEGAGLARLEKSAKTQGSLAEQAAPSDGDKPSK